MPTVIHTLVLAPLLTPPPISSSLLVLLPVEAGHEEVRDGNGFDKVSGELEVEKRGQPRTPRV